MYNKINKNQSPHSIWTYHYYYIYNTNKDDDDDDVARADW